MIKNKGFAFKLSIYILTVVSIIFLLSFIFNYYITRNIILDNIKETAKRITYENINKIEDVLNRIEKVPSTLARFIEGSDLTDAQLHDFIKKIVLNNDEIYGSAVAFETGKAPVRQSNYAPYYYKNGDKLGYINLGVDEYNFHQQDWYKIPKEMNTALWSEPYFDEGAGNILMTTYSVPFYKISNGKSEFLGIVTADISLSWLQEIVSSIKVLNNGFAFLLSKKGEIITHPNPNIIMKENIIDFVKNSPEEISLDMVYKMLAGEEGYERFESIYLKNFAWVFYISLPSSNWSLAVIFPEDELYSSIEILYQVQVVLGIVGFILLLIMIITFSKKLTKPLYSLSKATKVIAQGNFDVSLPLVQSEDEIGDLTNSMQFMLRELKTYVKNLAETTAEKEKIESELRIAHEIQMGMIPKTFPPFPTRSDVDIYAELIPAKEVGGDLYDYFFLDDSHLCVTVGDVSGKGVPASLLMAVTRTLLRSKAQPGMKSDELVNLINENLYSDNESRLFVTYFLGIIDLSNGNFDYTSAGHNPPYVIRKNGTVELLESPHSYPLGISNRTSYKSSQIKLQFGDKLFLYTDGITEAMNLQEIMFEDDNLKTILDNNYSESVEIIANEVMSGVQKFAEDQDQYDDMTVVAIELVEVGQRQPKNNN